MAKQGPHQQPRYKQWLNSYEQNMEMSFKKNLEFLDANVPRGSSMNVALYGGGGGGGGGGGREKKRRNSITAPLKPTAADSPRESSSSSRESRR